MWQDTAEIQPFLCNQRVYLPYAEHLLESLAHRPLVLVMDSSAIGRGCATLTINVIYRNRALPLAWIVLPGNKGHFAEASHLALLEQVAPLVPTDAEVVFLGDGEFDGTQLQETIDQTYQWKYVCRTAKSIKLKDGEVSFAPGEVALNPGECISFPRVLFTREEYGPVHVIAWWKIGYEEPIYLVTNVENSHQACTYYRKRFRIETFFSDQKSRGFHLHKSHLSLSDRLTRLMMPACLAYIWIIYLGRMATEEGWVPIIHRTDRCDLSLFQLGLRLLDHFLNEGDQIPVAFALWKLRPGLGPGKSVRW